MNSKQLHDNRLRIGKYIADRRAEKGVTQKQLAEATGLLQPNIARIEGGKYNVGIDILAKVASALECEILIRPSRKIKVRKSPVISRASIQ